MTRQAPARLTALHHVIQADDAKDPRTIGDDERRRAKFGNLFGLFDNRLVDGAFLKTLSTACSRDSCSSARDSFTRSEAIPFQCSVTTSRGVKLFHWTVTTVNPSSSAAAPRMPSEQTKCLPPVRPPHQIRAAAN